MQNDDMAIETENSKEKKYTQVVKALMKILAGQSMQEVSHSLVARVSGVSRPWLYKYIGKSSEDLLQFATTQIGNQLLNLGGLPVHTSAKDLVNHIFQASEYLFELSEQEKDIFKIYFKYLGTPTAIGKIIDQYEKNQIKNLSEAFVIAMKWDKQKSKDMAELILAFKMGVSGRIASGAMSKSLLKKELNRNLKFIFRLEKKA